MLSVDGQEVETFPAESLLRRRRSCLRRNAPWTQQAKAVYDLGDYRWKETWRRSPCARVRRGRAPRGARRLPRHAGTFAMGKQAVPRKHHLVLAPANRVLTWLEVYHYTRECPRGEFDKPFPPETEPGKVQWRKAFLENSYLDFANLFGYVEHQAVYAARFSTRRPTATCTLNWAATMV